MVIGVFHCDLTSAQSVIMKPMSQNHFEDIYFHLASVVTYDLYKNNNIIYLYSSLFNTVPTKYMAILQP